MQSSDRGPESLRTENNGAVHSSVSQEWLDFKGQRAKMLVEDRWNLKLRINERVEQVSCQKILSERTRTSDQPLFMEEQFVVWATVTLLVTWATYSYVQVMHRSKVKRRESCKRHVQRLESLLRAVSLSGRAKKYQGRTSGRRERTFLPRLSLWRLHKFTRSLTMPNSPSYSNSDN